MKNILIISPWADDWDVHRVIGWPEIGFLIKGFTEKGVNVHLIIPKKKGFTNSNIDRLFIYPIPSFWLPSLKPLLVVARGIYYLILNITFMVQSLKIRRLHSFDIIYGLSSFSALAVYWLGRRLDKPTILKLFGVITLYPIKRWNPLHWLVYFADVIAYRLPFSKLLAIDDGTQADKVADYFNVPQKRFLLYPHVADKRLLDFPYPENLKEKLGLRKEDYIILFVAKLNPFKRLDIALKSMKLILRSEPNARLLVVGDGPTRKRNEKLAKRLGIWKHVKFIGNVRYMDVWKYYRIGDVFLSTNIYSNLTLPVVEAMLSGIPVVALDVRDTHKLVKNGVTGFLVSFEKMSATCTHIADAVSLLLKDANARKTIANEAKKFVLNYFPDWNERVEREISLIKSLIKFS